MTARVEVENGILEGRVIQNEENPGQSYFAFQGIPYAKPPLGELRFKPPEPAEPWEGVKEVKEDGSPCFSRHLLISEEFIGSEDCLYLNVFTQKLPEKQDDGLSTDLKPVIVYIHGGSFTGGSNSIKLIGPQYLIREDVVFVSINYRLGFLGFFHLKVQSLKINGNVGFKDMVMALRWVKNNIKHFNGDPNNVTIVGESAGAAAVHLLVLSPMSRGLFHKAIIQSGCALNTWVESEYMAPEIAKALNMDDDDEEKLLQKLKEMKVEDLLRLQESFPDTWDVSRRRLVGFAVEDRNQEEEPFLIKHPYEIFDEDDYNHVPIIIGYTSREGMLVHGKDKKSFNEVTPDIQTTIPTYFELEKGSESSKRVSREIIKFYFGEQDPDEADIDNAYKIWSDNLFIRDIYRSVKAHVRTSDKPIFLYEVNIETSLNLFKKLSNITSPGVAHADDIFYMFKTILTGDIEPDSPEDIAIRRFCRLWANFARYGNPNSPTNDPLLPVSWKPFTKDTENFLDIDRELTAKVDPVKERMAFWEDLYQHRNEN